MFLLIVLATTTWLFAQEKEHIPDIEKVYLHTDRSTYVLGESLWYKAYLVYAYNNLLFNHSTILYVELISPDSKIISRNKTKLIGGLGHGDFKLTDSMGIKKPGVYQIRAYTNWIQNFGDDFVFKKDIEIIDVFETERIANLNIEALGLSIKEEDENTIQTIKSNIDIQFFPEGGSLIENVSSVVAFKAVDNHGNPAKVQGQILDAHGELVTMFLSVHDGMGKFQLKPQQGMQYYAKIIDETNAEIEVSLPKVSSQGYLLSYRQIKDQNILTVKTNSETLLNQPNPLLTIRYATRAVPYFEETLSLEETSLSIELPKSDLPEGISQITLYDAQSRPQSERLVYVEKIHDLKVEISTDKTAYKPKEKVVVNVSSKSNTGEAVLASYSLSITDLNGITDEKSGGSNISSYFLMESDIRGNVHHPKYYFDVDNPSRLQHLDLLLLTQGWRDFLWKKLPEVTDSLDFKVEKGINITGRVNQLFGEKPIEGNDVDLVIFNKSFETFKTTTDNLGKFSFNDVMITGKGRMILTTKNKKGRNNGILVLDSIFKAPMDVNFTGNTNVATNLGTSSEKVLMSKNIYKKHVAFEVLPDNILDEVEIVGKKTDISEEVNIHEKMFQGYVVDESSPKFANIFEMLTYAIPSLDGNTRDLIKFGRNTGGSLIVINQTRILDPAEERADMIVDYLSEIQPDDVVKIEYDNSVLATMMFGNQAKNGVILITTKPNTNFEKKSRNDLSTIKQQVEGYHEARLFYVPNLETSNSNLDAKAAIRNTLYWNPYVHPDKTGVSQMEYYNSAVETNVKVTLEGLTATGIPVVVKTGYTIKK
ncbi:hypothetical protein APS56_11110 [Pseudalgibacter alginicilyticus]|uniref:TonB-dependent receptor plug domain-containing protein n=1 Tax=Pseudalgibacter alginicilyticus TaxID=1736674 RepID=A0A0P0CYE0_9FLAO|nr:hypothetical protein [Pseudalgibacter alginicilyticus]ALJ05642.1 hypothetical protein APS56_11110 [Pseudalgibacter alginicilyticus]